MRAILLMIGLFIGGALQAQSLYNKNLISISPNTILFVDDSLVNNGTIVNNGDMQIGGAWINNSQYDAGQGQITFNSDLPQVINHNDQSFSKLTISGGGQKIFQANITIENELNLSEGILISQNGAEIIFNNTAQITGGSDDAYIQGKIYHKGPGAKLFPLGINSVYLPLTLTNVEGANAEIGVSVVDITNEVLTHDHSLDNISKERYWHLDVVSGSIQNSQVTLAVRNELIIDNSDQAAVAQSKTPGEKFASLGKASFQDGQVTSKSFVTAPFLAIGDVNDNGSVFVYNAFSPNGDEFNRFMRISNIESFPTNKVTLFNRWGDKVFEIRGYDNIENGGKVFTGHSNIGNQEELPAGTYFYVIDRNNGAPLVNGYVLLKR